MRTLPDPIKTNAKKPSSQGPADTEVLDFCKPVTQDENSQVDNSTRTAVPLSKDVYRHQYVNHDDVRLK